MRTVKYTKKYVTTDEAYKELDDTEFYTIKQIDDFIEDERFAERFTSFDIEHFRNKAIERMRGRLNYYHHVVLPGPCGSEYVHSQLMSTMSTGFDAYRKMKQYLGEDVTFGYPYIEGSRVIIEYLMHLWRKGIVMNQLKFVFSSDSVEAKFINDESTVSLEYFYDTPKSIIVSVMKGDNMYANELCRPDDVYMFVIVSTSLLSEIKQERLP